MFSIGQLVSTPAALEYMNENGINVFDLLGRHANCDWGDLDIEDKRRNDSALKDGSRIFSSYKVGPEKIWIITEADRSSTCVLLPSDY